MMMQLYTSPTTPFGRKIAVLLHEKSLLDRVELTLASGTPLDPGTMPIAHNPLGKIPVLVLDDGTAIYDSRVITRYLDDHFDLGIYPKGAALWAALTREAAVDGIIDAAVLMAYEMRLRPEDRQFTPWIDAQWSKITRALDMFESTTPESTTPESTTLSGDFDMPQIALACALSYLDFRHDARGWRVGRPNLAAWDQIQSGRKSMVLTAQSVT
jgi:glutathione S-transferase